MSISGSGGGPGDRLSFTEGGHHRPSPQGKREGCAGGARRVLGGCSREVLCDQGPLALGHFVKIKD